MTADIGFCSKERGWSVTRRSAFVPIHREESTS